MNPRLAEPTSIAAQELAATPPAPEHSPRDPRPRAALCYAVPLIPACFVLLRERHDHFVRQHAVRALLFYLTILAGQLGLLLALVTAGNVVGNFAADTVFGLLAYVAAVALAVWTIREWRRRIRASMAGQPLGNGRVDRAARWLEARTASSVAASALPCARQNSSQP